MMMKTSVFLLLALASSSASALELQKNRPVSKVVTLLKDMQNQLEKEAEGDEDTYEEMACWCETNDKDKTKAIADGEQRSIDLSSAIEEGEANSARLNSDIAQINAAIAADTKALDAATALRQKQLAEFNEEEKQMITSVTALKGAVTVISANHDAFLQTGKESAANSMNMINVAVAVKDTLHKHADILSEVITPAQRKALNTFLLAENTPMNAGSYAPQSGAVFGILKNMKETFEANMAKSQSEETTNQEAYDDLKKAKNSQIAASNVQLGEKSDQLGSTQEKLANDRQDLDDTQNTLAADQSFLANLKEKCSMFDAEFEARQKTRSLEIAAVSKAMAILSGDDAHALFSRTFNPAFLQKSQKVVQKVPHPASKKRVAAMKMKTRLSGFTAVKESLDEMIARLDKEKEDEILKKDSCLDNIRENERNTELKDREKEGLVAKIQDLTSTIDTLTTAINELKAEIGEMQLQMKKAGDDREEANREFQVTVADQRATQKLLGQALTVLQGFYDKKAALIAQKDREGEQQEPAGPPPPPDFKSYSNNNASGGVMGMIQQIINDAVAMEQDAIKAEEDSQSAYETFVSDTNASIMSLSRDISNKSETRAQAEADKAEANENLNGTMRELEYLAGENADLHSACDFTLNNFDVRQAARDDEKEALQQSKAILSGASYS